MVTNNINDVVKMLEDEMEALKKRPNRSDVLEAYINGIEHSIIMIRMECKDVKFEDPMPFSPQITVTPVYGCKIPTTDSYFINNPSTTGIGINDTHISISGSGEKTSIE